MSFQFQSRGLSSAEPSRKRKELSAYNADEPNVTSNRLLAGYMAHEFLTKGTILGRKFDPARAETSPFSAAAPQGKKLKYSIQSYADVATILKTDGAQIYGIVNPTQLARWLNK